MPQNSAPTPITRLLIANRGEIARRIMRTARARGIVCVAVYSDPDADALFVAEADHAVALGGTTSAESYLDAAKILAAAALCNVDAVHPGYGFLSENAAFAQAVQDAGLVWVGPAPASISAMAEKVPAKRLVAAAGVPLVPGAELDARTIDDATALRAAGASVGYPLMVKASAGGGGKGMRVVTSAADLAEAVAAAAREAASAFGDSTVFLERFLPAARHIEVQVFGDRHGQVVHLFERECSIQRRHQKVVEEAPAAHLPEAVRAGLHAAAVAAAAAIDYVGAGTVEFLVDGDDYYFLEMNTRLQVEHPVTEEVTGLDLVAWQFDVAEGRPLPTPPAAPIGHAIEARLYAEDARADDLPSTGTLTRFDLADDRIRVDTGVATGSVVSPYYDPMLAKVIAHGRSRAEAAARLTAALRAGAIHGVTTNRDMLVAILESDAFRDEVTTTAFLTDYPDVRHPRPDEATLTAHALAAAAALLREAGAEVPDVQDGVSPPAWRNVVRPGGVSVTLQGPSAELLRPGGVAVHRRSTRTAGDQWGLAEPADAIGEQSAVVDWLNAAVTSGVGLVTVVTEGGARHGLTATTHTHPDGSAQVWVDSRTDHTYWTVPPLFPDVDATGAAGGPSAPVPGTITAVMVGPGAEVQAGTTLVVLEAMKMEHRITAEADGTVTEVLVAVGDSVEAHQVLVRVHVGEDES
ncbi:MAG: propionyl-CoA carboxylase alpha chain [Actinomycetota bacterium]|nr:propionyl-CoA carboxylase alpha chain [Actinomycetota bacterium]